VRDAPGFSLSCLFK